MRKAGEFIYLHAVSKLISAYDLTCTIIASGKEAVTDTNMSFTIEKYIISYCKALLSNERYLIKKVIKALGQLIHIIPFFPL